VIRQPCTAHLAGGSVEQLGRKSAPSVSAGVAVTEVLSPDCLPRWWECRAARKEVCTVRLGGSGSHGSPHTRLPTALVGVSSSSEAPRRWAIFGSPSPGNGQSTEGAVTVNRYCDGDSFPRARRTSYSTPTGALDGSIGEYHFRLVWCCGGSEG